MPDDNADLIEAFRGRMRAYLLGAGAVVALDILTKRMVEAFLEPGEKVALAPFFNLVRTHNPGAAFSFLAQASGWQRWLLIAVAVAASALLLHLMLRRWGDVLYCVGLALILGGAIGNLYDRIALGYVVDFLDFHLAGAHWPAFNVADAAITAGAGLLIWEAVTGPPQKKPGEG